MCGRIRDKPVMIRQVWALNFNFEFTLLDKCLELYPILAIDTEFPGFIRSSPWGSNEEQAYEDLRFNVNQTKLIQLGLTATNEKGAIGGSWEFNFSDFDPETDVQDPSSISFLKQNGINFDKLKKYGIPISAFDINFLNMLRKNNIWRWITFHGLYDIGYVLKTMGGVDLPESLEEFSDLVAMNMGVVRDLKHMARFCDGLKDEKLGLERLGELLGEKRIGNKHNAGSDSLLTASLHFNMRERFGIHSEFCDGFLYGLSNKLQPAFDMTISDQIPYPTPLYCNPSYLTYY